jgi:hypothetical protein
VVSEQDKSKLRRLMELRVARDESKKAAEKAEAEYREIEAEVYEALEAVEGTIKVPLGDPWGTVSFRQRETYYGRLIDDEAALEYFARRAMLNEMTAPKFVKARLNEIVRDCVEQGNFDELPPGVDYYANRGVTITRPKNVLE